MATRPAGVKPWNADTVRQTIGEPETVVDVVDVPGSDPEMRFDLGWGQREHVFHERGGSWRVSVAGRQEMTDELTLFELPCAYKMIFKFGDVLITYLYT